jgi:transposase
LRRDSQETSDSEALKMSSLLLLSARQMGRISPFLPLAHGVPRVDNRRVVSGIVYVIKHGQENRSHP